MASTKEIKSRIKSVKNTKKITKAMELVAASKMKRAVSSTLASRLYAEYSWEIITSISAKLEDEMVHPFFTQKEEGKILIVLITSNRGLCGGYNAQVVKKTILKLQSLENEQVDFITIGKKGDGAMRRTGQNVIATFVELPDAVSLSDISSISRLVSSEYKNGTYKDIYVAYTDFISALTQTPRIRQLLPITRKELKKAIQDVGDQKSREMLDSKTGTSDYTFEGDMNTLIESMAEKLVKMQIYQMLLESNASEQSSRMVAMKNASDAAGEMIDDLTLVFNKARQASITQEISEISAGMASVS
jgi:F-type H+-transporting ATPase subunit gamma